MDITVKKFSFEGSYPISTHCACLPQKRWLVPPFSPYLFPQEILQPSTQPIFLFAFLSAYSFAPNAGVMPTLSKAALLPPLSKNDNAALRRDSGQQPSRCDSCYQMQYPHCSTFLIELARMQSTPSSSSSQSLQASLHAMTTGVPKFPAQLSSAERKREMQAYMMSLDGIEMEDVEQDAQFIRLSIDSVYSSYLAAQTRVRQYTQFLNLLKREEDAWAQRVTNARRRMPEYEPAGFVR